VPKKVTLPLEDEEESTSIYNLTDQESEMLKHKPDNNGNANCAKYMLKNKAIYTYNEGWRVWNGRFWEINNIDINNYIITVLEFRRETAKKVGFEKLEHAIKIDAKDVHGCEQLLRYMLWIGNDESGSEKKFNTYIENGENIAPFLIPCANIIVDIRTKKTYKHDPKYMLTRVFPTKYIPSKRSKKFEEFLTSSVGGGIAGVDFLLMYAGYALTGCGDAKKIANLYGPTNSGKGTFKDVYKAVTGSSTVEVDYSVLAAKRSNNTSNFDLYSLYNARTAFCSEPEEGYAVNSEQIKKFTGDGDDVTTSKKFKDAFTFSVTTKFFILSNFMIRGKSTDTAFWNRLVLISFPVDRAKSFDPNVKRDLLKKDNIEAALNAFIQGGYRWYTKNRKLDTPAAFIKEKQDLKDEYDQVKNMLDEYFIPDDNAFTPNSIIMREHKRWSMENGTHQMGPYTLGGSLAQKGYKRGSITRKGKTQRGHHGLRPRTKIEGGMTLIEEIVFLTAINNGQNNIENE